MEKAQRNCEHHAAAAPNNKHEVLPNWDGLCLTHDVMDSIKSVARTLGPAGSYISLSQLYKYWHVASCIKDDILAVYPSNQPLDATAIILPPDSRNFLSSATNLDDNEVEAVWNAIRDMVWSPLDEHLKDVQNDQALAGVFQRLENRLYREFITLSLAKVIACMKSALRKQAKGNEHIIQILKQNP
jgi:hypothetical protein